MYRFVRPSKNMTARPYMYAQCVYMYSRDEEESILKQSGKSETIESALSNAVFYLLPSSSGYTSPLIKKKKSSSSRLRIYGISELNAQSLLHQFHSPFLHLV